MLIPLVLRKIQTKNGLLGLTQQKNGDSIKWFWGHSPLLKPWYAYFSSSSISFLRNIGISTYKFIIVVYCKTIYINIFF